MITLANIRRAVYYLNKRLDLFESKFPEETITIILNKVKSLENLISEDSNPTQAIDKFNEIVSFLESIPNTNTLLSLLGDLPTKYVSAVEPLNFTESQKQIARANIDLDNISRLGCGYGVCSTDATVVAKDVTISNFSLAVNGSVSVRFTKAVNVNNATLNVNGTGAKPIYYNGSALQPMEIKAGITVTLTYDGTNWNITSLLGYEQSGSQSDLWVDMGLPSGTLWAKRNIDVTQDNGFAASEYQYECSFFSWGNVDGHNPTSSSSFSPYSWGRYITDEPYVSSEGAKIIYPGVAGPSHDAARTILGTPWRLPDSEDYDELFNSEYTKFIDGNGDDIAADVTDKRVSMPAASDTGTINGIRIKSKINGNIIFFPCIGYGLETNKWQTGNRGLYWTRSLNADGNGLNFGFSNSSVIPVDYDTRSRGFAIRPVQ